MFRGQTPLSGAKTASRYCIDPMELQRGGRYGERYGCANRPFSIESNPRPSNEGGKGCLMFLEVVRSEGLAHLSYLLGGGGEAFVIDPRRDCRVYEEIARSRGARITRIFETHRNEDYVVGSSELARRTGAEVLHGGRLDFAYGTPVAEGDRFRAGDLELRVLETPGHTDESISIAFADKGFGDAAVGVFTGDALFIGDVGRTDFYPDRAEEMAGLLYDSIFEKILPLGDHVVLYPAHGAGSVCGQGMADREISTLGYERRFNPALQVKGRAEFVERKLREQHDQPPYFRQMERFNQDGSAPPVPDPIRATPMSAERFQTKADEGAVILDVRSPEAMGGALIPGSLGIPLEMVPAFAGWFLPYDRDVLLVVQEGHEVDLAVRFLLRLGYDRVPGYLDEGLHAWEITGRDYQAIPSISARELVRRIDAKERFILLDVRKESEFKAGHLPDAQNLYVGELPGHLDRIPGDRPVVTFCGSGIRAVIAATILKQHGFRQVENCLGSMAACSAAGCPIQD